MWVHSQAFHVPKQGNAESEYEDAFFPRNGSARELTDFRCAVADGASESAFADLWAQLLVRSFGRRRLRLARLRKLWQRAISGREIPWYLEKKIVRGAHAAFVGLSIRAGAADGQAPPEGGSWRALAVGDSCVFHVRDGALVASGPVDRADAFNNSPHLISSKARHPIRRGDEHVVLLSGEWQAGDTFYLATDAIAQWLLAEHEAGRPHWSRLRELQEKVFGQMVAELRDGGVLHNDDTTLMRVEVS